MGFNSAFKGLITALPQSSLFTYEDGGGYQNTGSHPHE